MAIEGVLAAQTEPTGRTFALFLESAASADLVAAEALRLLGSGTCRLDDAAAALENVSEPGVPEWLDARAVRLLSRLEARILALRWGSRAGEAAGLAQSEADRLVMLLRRDLCAEFDRVHDEGGARERGWHRAAFAAAFARTVEAFARETDAARAALAGAELERCLDSSP